MLHKPPPHLQLVTSDWLVIPVVREHRHRGQHRSQPPKRPLLKRPLQRLHYPPLCSTLPSQLHPGLCCTSHAAAAE